MKSLSDQMAVYAAYHRHPVNRAIHFFGIPAIVWSLMVFMAFVPLFSAASMEVTLAHVAVAALLIWYLVLDYALGVAAVLLFTVLMVAALHLDRFGTRMAWWISGSVFVLGWVVQFIGHGVWEKRRPALMDNLTQVFVAPIFLVAETAFAMGLKSELRDEVHRKMKAHLPKK